MSDTLSHMPIPFGRQALIDLIRFSDGQLTPEEIGRIAEERFFDLICHNFDHFGPMWFGDRAAEFASIYFPEVLEDQDRQDLKPLIWKEVTLAPGTEVRMNYGGEDHFAKVKGGKIVDDDDSYSPSEWASKVAAGTARNAWRDLWFREPHARNWTPAQTLRRQARASMEASDE